MRHIIHTASYIILTAVGTTVYLQRTDSFGDEMRGKKGKFKNTVCMTTNGRHALRAVLVLILSVAMQCLSVSATEEQPATGPDWAIDTATAPAVVSESAILMDIDTSVILYEKNIHTRQYPASITKLLTCLVAAENSELTDVVTFSKEAVFGIEPGSSSIGIDVGEQLTMEQCYYAALLESANEVSAGIAEHVGGSEEGFAAMMNEKVKELGGTDSNFVNANGLHDDNHYTSAYDMALIGQAFARNETLLEISGTAYYHIDPTAMQPEAIDLRNHHCMLPGCQRSGARPCEYVIGGKTGYTTVSQNTLVTFAKKDGHRLVCVVLKGKKASYFEDTLALINYGFDCYDDVSVKALIDAKIGEIQAQEAAEEETAEEEVRAEQQFTQAEMDDRVESAGSSVEIAGEEESRNEEESRPQEEKSGGLSILTIIVIIVVLAAVGVCGFIFYRSYRREQERKRRRAEIMARHRARRAADNG